MLFFGLCICEAWWEWNMANLEKENESYKGLVGLVVKDCVQCSLWVRVIKIFNGDRKLT
jgi:hypothetical protein